MIKAVFFDLDGTLYDRDASFRALVEEQYVAFERNFTGISKEHFLGRVLEMDDHGYGDKDEGYQRIVEEWGFGSELSSQLSAHFWSNYNRFCELSEDTATTLQTLKDRGKYLGVITNGSGDWQRRKLEALGPIADVRCRPHFGVGRRTQAVA